MNHTTIARHRKMDLRAWEGTLDSRESAKKAAQGTIK